MVYPRGLGSSTLQAWGRVCEAHQLHSIVAWSTDEALIMSLLDHDIASFGASVEVVRQSLESRCESLTQRTPALRLSVTRETQLQLECHGYQYWGRTRFVELIFSDDALDIVHIMGTESDHEELRKILRRDHGNPTFSSEHVEWNREAGISLRTRPHEISFVSPRVSEEYEDFMASLGEG